MKLSEYITKLEKVQQELPQKGEEISKEVAQLGIDTVRDRSIKDGIDVNGITGNKQEYSKYPIGTSRFIGKELNQSGRDFIKKNRLGTWEDFREEQGLQGGNINLDYTGAFWNAVKQQYIKIDENKVSITVEPDTSEPSRYPNGSKLGDYIGSLTRKYGNVLKPTTSEETTLKNLADAKMRNYLISELSTK